MGNATGLNPAANDIVGLVENIGVEIDILGSVIDGVTTCLDNDHQLALQYQFRRMHDLVDKFFDSYREQNINNQEEIEEVPGIV